MMALYSLLLGTGLLVSSPWLLLRMLTTHRYREGLRERLGRVPARLRAVVKGRQVVWVHAVSVGEVLVAAQLLSELESRLTHAAGRPWRVVVSTTTRTGQQLARERFGGDRVFWFPLDFRWAVRAWLRALQPALLVLVESELWPRLLTECERAGTPVAVVNARMSDRSFRRARRFERLWKRVLGRVTLFLPQSEETGRRLEALGVNPARVRVTGNLKYDAQPRETEMVKALRPLLGRRTLVVAGSLVEAEDAMVMQSWAAVCPTVSHGLLLLAPRHAKRFSRVAEDAALQFPTVRASQLRQAVTPEDREVLMMGCAVLLLDTVGDLAALYALADVAFVGGSLVERGGHNPLEPARFGVPVLMGPSFENFREIVEEMRAAEGIALVRNSTELAHAMGRLLKDRVEADALGRRGQQVFAARSGATRRTVAALLSLAGVPPGTTAGARP